jgi:hypothetical protein
MTIQASCAWAGGNIIRNGNNVSFSAPYQGVPINDGCQGSLNIATFNGTPNTSGNFIGGSYSFPNGNGGNFTMSK